jgi:hypothetical protein
VIGMGCSELATYDFELRKGNDKTLSFRYLTDDNLPVDLTGALIVFQTTIPVLVQDAVITDAVDGQFTITFDRAATVDLTENRVSYEIEMYPTGLTGTKDTLFGGKIKLTNEVLP